MTGKRALLGGAALAALGVIALTGAIVWYTTFRDDAPSQVSLSDAVASLDSSTAAPQASDAAALAGTWVLAPGSDSFVGYRVKEELARVGATTAVGRTKDITANLTFDGSAITNVQVSADLTTLQSDSAMRDGQLRRQALETNTYPTATFNLTQPITLTSIPAEGAPLAVRAVGDLTLHGVTRSVGIDLQGQRMNGLVVVVGSMDIAFADFNITPPSAASVLSVEDRGLLELQLVFQRKSQG
jgi:polyisoprenoid-binding protein YceI